MKRLKGIILLMAIAVVAVGIVGCSKSKKSSANPKDSASFKVDGENNFTVTYSEDFEESYYSKDELEEQVNREIKEFNENDAVDSSKGISVESLSVKNKKATLKLKFTNYQDYMKYSSDYVDSKRNAKLFIGTYDEALAAGYTISGLLNVEDSAEMTAADIEKEKDELLVIYTNEGVSIAVEGKIIAADKNVKVSDGVAKTSDKRENCIIYKKKTK